MASTTEQTDLTETAAIDPDEFRQVMATYPTGITVLTAQHDDGPVGMSANSFVSVSLEPPLVLFCAAYSSTTWPLIEEAGHFTVNIMPESAREIAAGFATKGIDRFAGVAHQPGVTGAPVLDAARSYLECLIETTHEAGDHALVVGRVVSLEDRGGQSPLVFFESRYRELVPAD